MHHLQYLTAHVDVAYEHPARITDNLQILGSQTHVKSSSIIKDTLSFLLMDKFSQTRQNPLCIKSALGKLLAMRTMCDKGIANAQ